MYPTNRDDFRAALLAYAPPEDVQEAIYAAQAATSVVVAAVEVFNTLKTIDVDEAGLRLLLGAAHLIAAGGWYGLSGEAATLLGQRARELDLPDAPAPEEA